FAEVRENRFFDDVAGRLGHETTHAGQLPDLLAIATGARVHHEGDGVVFLFALVLVQRAQHDVSDLVGAMRPNINDLVVTLAGSDNAFAILLLDFANLLLRRVNFLVLFLRNDHVIDADGNSGASGFAEAKLLKFVQHDDGFFVATNLVALPDQVSQL